MSQESELSQSSTESNVHDDESDFLPDLDSDATYFSDGDPANNDESSNDNGDENEAPDWDLEMNEELVYQFESQLDQICSELNISAESTPLQILRLMITDEMVESICLESNRYAAQKGIPKFVEITPDEFWRFLAITLAMGLVKKGSIDDYWAVKTLIPTPFFGTIMKRDRYRQILRSLHFVDNESRPRNCSDRFGKLGNFMSDFLSNARRLVKPGEYLCMDESFVKFKGRLSIKQYNAMKRARFGIKLFKLADCQTKMILDILPYQGAATRMKYRNLKTTLGFGGAAVLSMLEPYFEKGHKVVIDNYFNSPKLARRLANKKTYVLGTVQKRRQGMPKGRRMTRKMKKGEIEIFSDGKILIERWCDRRDVHMLNTFMGHSMHHSDSRNPNNTRQKPGSVILYNSKMGAIDDSDKVIAPVTSIRKSYKWYRKVAFHVFDLAVYNSFQLLKTVQGPQFKFRIYRNFLEGVIEEMKAEFPAPPSVRRGRPSQNLDCERLRGPHFPQRVQKNDGKISKSSCTYCRKVYGKVTSTVFGCKQCGKRLCVGTGTSCFELFHTQATLRKVQSPPRKRQRLDAPEEEPYGEEILWLEAGQYPSPEDNSENPTANDHNENTTGDDHNENTTGDDHNENTPGDDHNENTTGDDNSESLL